MNPVKIQNAGLTERVFREEIRNAALRHLYMFLCFWYFFPEIALGHGPKNGIYFVQHGISPLILAYAISNGRYKIAQLTLCTICTIRPNCDVTSDVFGFFLKLRSVTVPKIYG